MPVSGVAPFFLCLLYGGVRKKSRRKGRGRNCPGPPTNAHSAGIFWGSCAGSLVRFSHAFGAVNPAALRAARKRSGVVSVFSVRSAPGRRLMNSTRPSRVGRFGGLAKGLRSDPRKRKERRWKSKGRLLCRFSGPPYAAHETPPMWCLYFTGQRSCPWRDAGPFRLPRPLSVPAPQPSPFPPSSHKIPR